VIGTPAAFKRWPKPVTMPISSVPAAWRSQSTDLPLEPLLDHAGRVSHGGQPSLCGTTTSVAESMSFSASLSMDSARRGAAGGERFPDVDDQLPQMLLVRLGGFSRGAGGGLASGASRVSFLAWALLWHRYQ
jgi:hypothetical protein